VKLGARGYFAVLMLIVLVTDITILLDISILRQILGFLSFTIIPGHCIIYILKRHKISFVKHLLLSIGLSIAFLMFVGLITNILLSTFGYATPLATISLVISFSIGTSALCFIAYCKNRSDFQPPFKYGPQKNFGSGSLSLLLFPILFPFMSILGTYLMNTTGNNILLMTMLFLIILYVILIICFHKTVFPLTYLLALWTISIALLLMHTLTSNYFLGTDSYFEYSIYQNVSHSLNWNTAILQNDGLAGCLSVSLLPTIYHSLVGTSDLVVIRIIYPLIASLIPIACYVLYRKYMGNLYTFISSIFFIAQIAFLYELGNHLRIEMSVLFFALVLIVIFDDEIGLLGKRLLFLVFTAAVVASYYVAPVILLALLAVSWLIAKPFNKKMNLDNIINGPMVAICIVLIFVWWSIVTQPIFSSYIYFTSGAFSSFGNLFQSDLRTPELGQVQGFLSGPFAARITVIVQLISSFLIGIGTLHIAMKYKEMRFEATYIIMLLFALVTMGSLLIIPYLTMGYAGNRLYLQLLVVLAPAFVVGVETISRFLRPRAARLVIVFFLIAQFLSSSFLIQQLSGIPYSESLNNTGTRHDIYYVYIAEVKAAGWLKQHTNGTLDVSMDYTPFARGGGIFLLDDFDPERIVYVNTSFGNGEYIFLRRVNVVNRLVYNQGTIAEARPLAESEALLTYRNKIYCNNGAEIYK
jgi:uncharacterized membrane protein